MDPLTKTNERLSLISLFATLVLANGPFVFEMSKYIW